MAVITAVLVTFSATEESSVTLLTHGRVCDHPRVGTGMVAGTTATNVFTLSYS